MFEYRLIRSGRRTVAIEIKDGCVLVRAPLRTSLSDIESLIAKNSGWIEKRLALAAAEKERALPPLSRDEVGELAAEAALYIPSRVKLFAPRIGVEPQRVTVRAQRTKWGSCSAKGNLNFNCLLMLAPPSALDAVVVHELCHMKHMDHSAAFYAEVARVLPDYRANIAWLKENGSRLLARLPEK